METCADEYIENIKTQSCEASKYLNIFIHQVAQARPDELSDFVLNYSKENAVILADVMVLAWRIVGNEFKDEMAEMASNEISRLCDLDEWENATLAFRNKD